MAFLPSDPSKESLSPTATKVVMYTVGVFLAAIVFPSFFHSVAEATSNIVAIAVGGLALWGMIQITPWLSRVVSNGVLKMIKFEARRNPVETRQRIASERRAEIEAAKVDAKATSTANSQYGAKVATLTSRYPAEARKFQDHLAALQTIEKGKYTAIRQAEAAMVEFDATTDKVQAIWEVTALARQAGRSAGSTAEKEALRKIEEDETIRAADDAMAQSFAELTAAVQLSPNYEAPEKHLGQAQVVQQSLPAPVDNGEYLPAQRARQEETIRRH